MRILMLVLQEGEMDKYFTLIWHVINTHYFIHRKKVQLMQWSMMIKIVCYGLQLQIIALLNSSIAIKEHSINKIFKKK
jgi:hypothetical protein